MRQGIIRSVEWDAAAEVGRIAAIEESGAAEGLLTAGAQPVAALSLRKEIDRLQTGRRKDPAAKSDGSMDTLRYRLVWPE